MDVKLSLLAQFDDLCRVSKTLFEIQDGDISDMLAQSESNRLQWLDLQHQLSEANQRIKSLSARNEELEGKLKRLRTAFGMELKKSEEKDKECAKLRKIVDLIRECITDDHRFSTRVMKHNSNHLQADSLSSNSDYHSDSYRDLMMSILNNSDEYLVKSRSTIGLNRRITTKFELSTASSDDDDLQFDKTEDDLHLSCTNLEPDHNYRPSAPPPTPGNERKVFTANGQTCAFGTQKRQTSPPSAYPHEKVAVTSSEDDCPTSSKYSRNTPSISTNSDNQFGGNEESNCREDNAMNCKRDDDAANRNDNNRTAYITPKSTSSPNLRSETGNTIESRRRLLRSASVKKIKIDLSRLDKRPHNLLQKKAFKPMTCVPCGKNIGFCSKVFVCLDCRTVCHITCQQQLSLPCIPHYTPKAVSRSGNHMLMIGDFIAQDVRPFVPSLLVHCCNEIERRGLMEEGIYRKCGSDREVRELKSKFLLSKTGPPNISKIDIHVLCGLVKMFLRDLDDPLITRILWHDFARASDISAHGEEKSTELLKRSIDQLPDPNRDTLAFLILHLQRVADACKENKMTISSLGRIFGPTVIGQSTPNQFSNVLAENVKQTVIMQGLLSLPTDYWKELLCEAEIFKTPAAKLNTSYRKFATTGGKSMNALSPLSYRSASSSIYATPAGIGRVTRYAPVKPCNLFGTDPII